MNVLILIDLQRDFCAGGALAVREGEAILPGINAIQRRFELVVATQDWHPAGHLSFASSHDRPVGTVIDLHGRPQVLWPDHCVQGTPGADFHPDLDLGYLEAVFRKGQNPAIDSYSGFFDNDHANATGLEAFLREIGATRLFLVGLATDYCVKYTALDAARLGFDTTVLVDLCRGVELQPGDVDRAVAEMEAAGVRVASGALFGV